MQINPQTTGAPVSSDPTRAADPEHILIQLHRILGSRLFRDSHRLQTFLRYVVTETLEGRAGRIKGFTVAQAVFDRQDPEDAQASTIVRVEASRLRRLLGEYYLGEGRGDPIRIEVPKGGYVPSFEPNPPDASISTSTESEPAGSSRTRFLIGMVAAVSAFAMALMVYLPRHDLAQSTRDPSGFAPTVAPGVPAIAVLPFEDRTTDGRAASVADGLTEDIITDLSRVPGIDVIAFSSVLPFRGQDTDTDQLAQELQVSHVLRGSIRGTPPTLRVTARLLELSTNRELWADRFDRHLSDELSLQGELSQSVVESLTANLLPADRLPTRPAPLAHIEARTLYQQAMNLANPPSDSGRLAVAARAFERVIEMAPDFAGGYAGAAYIGAFRAFWGSSDVSDTDLQKAVSLANRATELDPNFGLAYTALAFAHLSNRDFDAALGASIQAIEAQPGDPYLNAYHGVLLSFNGEPSKGLTYAKRALRLDPLYVRTPHLNILGVIAFQTGDYAQALDAFGRNLDRGGPVNPVIQAYLVATYMALGRTEQARSAFEWLTLYGPGFDLEKWLRRAYRFAPDSDRVLNLLDQADFRSNSAN
jgi:TolB-like protein/Flp pilus assembly protein TadD